MEGMMEIWKKFNRPPETALKSIQAGRLKGKSDINPQWRYQAMTEVFGPCGIGWKYTIDSLWTVPASDNQHFAFANISLYIKQGYEWSEPIPANGGSIMVAKESSGMHSNDEAYKMAITDALGTAMKMLGVAAEIYLGNWDGSKYKNIPEDEKPKLLTKDQLVEKMKTSSNDFELSARKKKYKADYDSLTPEQQVDIRTAADKRKTELSEVKK